MQLLVVKTQDRAWPSWPVKTKFFQRFHCTRGGPRTCKRDGVPKKEITGKKTLSARRSDLWPVRPTTCTVNGPQQFMQHRHQTCSKVCTIKCTMGSIRVATRRTFVRAPAVLFTRHSSTCSVALMMSLACKACLGDRELAGCPLKIHEVNFFVEKSSLWEKNVFS